MDCFISTAVCIVPCLWTERCDHTDHSFCIWHGKQKKDQRWNPLWSYLYHSIDDPGRSHYWDFSKCLCCAVQCRSVKSVFYRRNENYLDQFYICRNQCGISGNLSGFEWRSWVACHITSQTACDHIAIGSDFFCLCKKWSDRCFVDLVGVPDYRICLMLSGICIFEENTEKQGR